MNMNEAIKIIESSKSTIKDESLYKALEIAIDSMKNQSSCSFGDIKIKPDGIHELSPHRFKEEQLLHNVTVQILKCCDCGEISVGWIRQPDTWRE